MNSNSKSPPHTDDASLINLDAKENEAVAIHNEVWDYFCGQLQPEDAARVALKIASDPRAAESLQACQQVEAYSASAKGQAYLAHQTKLLQQKLSFHRSDQQKAPFEVHRASTEQTTRSSLAPKLAALSSRFTMGFRSLPLRAAASEASAGEKVLWEHEDDSGKQQILEDRFGRYFLSVTTRDEEIAKAGAEVRLVEPKPVLSFKKLLPGLFAGRVEISREFAQQVASGEMGFDLDAPGTTNQG